MGTLTVEAGEPLPVVVTHDTRVVVALCRSAIGMHWNLLECRSEPARAFVGQLAQPGTFRLGVSLLEAWRRARLLQVLLQLGDAGLQCGVFPGRTLRRIGQRGKSVFELLDLLRRVQLFGGISLATL